MKLGTAIALTTVGLAGSALVLKNLPDAPDLSRIIVGGIAFVIPWVVHAALVKPTCSFLFITDTHGQASFNAALVTAMLKEENISFVAHGGDIADAYDLWDAWWDSPFARVIARWPVYAAQGNHDVSTDGGRLQFENRFDGVPHKVACGDAEVYFMPWAMTRVHAEWLYAAVQASTTKYRILVIHKPVWPVSEDDVRVRNLLTPVLPRINLVLSGHEHVYQDSMHGDVQQIIEVSGPKYYACPEGQHCVVNESGFTRVDVYSGELRTTHRVVATAD